MRSGSDGVELDRSSAALHGPRTGPPPLRPCCDRTIGLVQRASRADGPVPSAEIRHPGIGHRPDWLMPSNERRHATAYDGGPVNSVLRTSSEGYREGL
ncbi:hypothetical protein CP976_27845 [Streptomyces coeruleorubidus]|uniref:Uncharacterized protein n=1 Tax=Streptomyces coeruleorubidus TaxID=116188 RepID=A0A5J6I9T4_STRC4|nr:hypothetical protein CP976_27845 [Streptomyces coeruleorubidus]